MTEIILKYILLIALGYLVGSIPFGVIISKQFFGFDIRTKGSKNMGSTNVSRVLGTKWGIIVQLLDILKGAFSVLVFGTLIGNNWGLCDANSFLNLPILEVSIGSAAIVGHCFSCFIGFKGGKGVNTAIGMFIATLPIEVGIGIGLFIIIVGITGYVSLGSIIGSISLPITLLIRYNCYQVDVSGYLTLIYFVIAFDLLVIIAHRQNIVRLIKGQENRMDKMRFIYKCRKKRYNPN